MTGRPVVRDELTVGFWEGDRGKNGGRASESLKIEIALISFFHFSASNSIFSWNKEEVDAGESVPAISCRAQVAAAFGVLISPLSLVESSRFKSVRVGSLTAATNLSHVSRLWFGKFVIRAKIFFHLKSGMTSSSFLTDNNLDFLSVLLADNWIRLFLPETGF